MRRTQTVEWAADQAYRFTLQTVTVAGDMHRADLLTAGHGWFAQRYGVDSGEAIDEYRSCLEAGEVPAAVQRRFSLLWRITDWASVMASLVQLEIERDGKWEAVGVSEQWKSYEAFAEEVPQELFGLLAETAHAVNPSLWRIAGDDDAKKNEQGSAS